MFSLAILKMEFKRRSDYYQLKRYAHVYSEYIVKFVFMSFKW